MGVGTTKGRYGTVTPSLNHSITQSLNHSITQEQGRRRSWRAIGNGPGLRTRPRCGLAPPDVCRACLSASRNMTQKWKSGNLWLLRDLSRTLSLSCQLPILNIPFLQTNNEEPPKGPSDAPHPPPLLRTADALLCPVGTPSPLANCLPLVHSPCLNALAFSRPSKTQPPSQTKRIRGVHPTMGRLTPNLQLTAA